MAASHWDECALPACSRFFWNVRGESKCCSATCARKLRYLDSATKRKSVIELFEKFARQPDVRDNKRVLRAAWRVFVNEAPKLE